MKTKHSYLILVMFFALQFSQAQITFVKHKNNKTYNIPKWEVIDVAIKAKTKIKNPFVTDFGATFTHENGSTQKVPGFYNGNNEWVIRFSNAIQGKWKFVTYGKDKKLKNKKGTINVGKPKANKHGSIVIEKDSKKFSYEDGSPYFLLAFECDWLYGLDYHNETQIPKTEHLLNLIQENGFNQVVMNVFSYDVRWKKDKKLAQHPDHEFGAPKDIFPFLGNNEKPDFSSLNVDFFKKFDRTISTMNDKQIVSHLMIYVWNKLVAWPDMYSDADNMYFDYVVKRYQAFPNMLWDISKEALYYGRADANYIKERIERVRKLDSYKRLLTVHDFGFCKKNPETVDFISSQDWSHNIYNKMLDAHQQFKNKPVFNIEHGGYEKSPYVVFTGNYDNAEACLRRNYMCLFAGVYTTYYWQGTSWNALIYNPYQQPKGVYKPKFEYFKHMNKLFQKVDFTKLTPMPHRNAGSYNLSTKDLKTVLLYVPKECHSMRSWIFKKEIKKRSFEWFNTLTGEFAPCKGPDAGQYYSPWQGKADAILISKLK
ncbi:apiosidase-like domain-containing protein [Wenyingzhuangia sp. IMCC45574]